MTLRNIVAARRSALRLATLQVQQLAIKEGQLLSSDLRSPASGTFHRQCIFLRGNKGICSTAIQQASVVQTGDDAQQRV
jgi:hypothetical protein